MVTCKFIYWFTGIKISFLHIECNIFALWLYECNMLSIVINFSSIDFRSCDEPFWPSVAQIWKKIALQIVLWQEFLSFFSNLLFTYDASHRIVEIIKHQQWLSYSLLGSVLGRLDSLFSLYNISTCLGLCLLKLIPRIVCLLLECHLFNLLSWKLIY